MENIWVMIFHPLAKFHRSVKLGATMKLLLNPSLLIKWTTNW